MDDNKEINIKSNKEDNIKKIEQKLAGLKNKEKSIEELNDFSKRLYFSSIPVMLLFTAFIELLFNIQQYNFNVSEYLMLNGITIPCIFLANNFICGTSIGRKKKTAEIRQEIKDTEDLIITMSEEEQLVNTITSTNNDDYTIKPISREYELNNSKPYTKKLVK